MILHKKITYATLALFTFIFSNTFGQSNKAANFNEGYITYEIQVSGMPEIAEFLKETTLTLYIKGEKSKVDLKIMGGFAQMQLVSNQINDLHTVLMDLPMLPEKVSIPLVGEDDFLERLKAKTHTNHSPKNFSKILHYEKETKKIAKQPCYRADMNIEGDNNYALLYLTKKIKPTHSIEIFEQFGIEKELPLALNLTIEGMHIYLIAKEFKKGKVDDALFEVSDEYNQQTFKELKDSIEDVFGSTRKEGIGL